MLFVAILIWVWWWARHEVWYMWRRWWCSRWVHHGVGCWHEHLPQHLEHSNFMLPLLLLSSPLIFCFKLHPLFFKLHPLLISLPAALGKSLCHTIDCCFHLCPLAFLLLLLLRRSMLLWTCCGNSFILQLLRRCGAAPWGWPMLLSCLSAAVQTASGFSCFFIIWIINRSRHLFSAVARTQWCLLLKSIQQCTRAIQWPVANNRID